MTNTGRPMTAKSSLKFEDFVGLTWSIIYKYKTDQYIENDDLFQELSLVWLKCYNLYDPSHGADFFNYYYTSAVNYILRLKEKYSKEQYLYSLDYNISLTPKYDLPISDLYVDDGLDIEQAFINEEIIYRFLTHPYGALAKYLLRGKTIPYAADRLEVDPTTARRWLQKMIEDVRNT